jgi:hypothetical protein
MLNSGQTSRSQVPASFRMIPWKRGSRNMDLGCGKYPELLMASLALDHEVNSLAWDPVWFPNWVHGFEPDTHKNPVDTITVNNVLNVLKFDNDIQAIIDKVYMFGNEDTTVYFLIYEGDRSGVGRDTKCGYQRNQKTKDYLKYLETWFRDIKIKKNLISCKLFDEPADEWGRE